MRYVIVCVVKGNAGSFNNNLRKEVYEKFHAKSSKLPAHFTIKSPFECNDISKIEKILNNFSKKHKKEKYEIDGYDHFDDRVIYMKILMSNEGKILHDKLIDELNSVKYINFTNTEGKSSILHITISSKKIQKIFNELWNYVTYIPCKFNCFFDNISIFKWENNTWILHKEYKLN